MLINPAVPAGGRSAELMKNCHGLPALWAAVTGSAIFGLVSGNLPEYPQWHFSRASW